MLMVGANFEGHEVSEIETSCFLKLRQDIVGRSNDAQIDMFSSRARAFDTELQHEPHL